MIQSATQEIREPSDVEAEKEILLCCLHDAGSPQFDREDVIKLAIAECEPGHFAHPHYKKIYVALVEAVQDAGTGKVEWVEIRDRLHEQTQAKRVLRDMATDAEPYPYGERRIRNLLKRLQSAYRSRKIIDAGEYSLRLARANDAENAYIAMMDAVQALARDRFSAGAQYVDHYIDEAILDAEQRRNTEGIVGLRTGIDAIDRVFKGLQRKMLIIVAARPGNYKSTALAQMALNLARQGKKALIVSPEMAAMQYITRWACTMAGLDYDRYNGGEYSEEEEANVKAKMEELRDKLLIINEAGTQTISSIRQDIIRFRPDAVFIDYMQLIEPSKPTGNEYRDVGQVSRDLAAMKKDFGIPIVVAAQLSRKVEERMPPRPIASDIRATGQIEQDADGIMMLYRPREYAEEDSFGRFMLGKGEDRHEVDPNLLEWICVKNRHGARKNMNTYVREGEMWIHNEEHGEF